MCGVFDRCFIEMQKIRQSNVSCQEDIGNKLSSSDSTTTNRRENGRFWSRNGMWETCDMAMCNSGCD